MTLATEADQAETTAGSAGDKPVMSPRQPKSVKKPDAAVAMFVLVQVGMLLSQFWKLDFFRFAWSIYRQASLNDEFFPALMREPWMLGAAFVGVAAATVVAIAIPSMRLVAVAVQWLGCIVLCLHQATYNDATFTTMWWTSTWSVWMAARLRRKLDHGVLIRRAALLGRCIVSMILLGGAVGKWTADYWSGEVLYDIYFVDRDFWVFNQIRESFSPPTIRQIATWYSRMVVVTETVVGLTLWLMPARIAAWMGVTLLASIAIFSNFLLFSVMSCLIALVASGFFVDQSLPRSASSKPFWRSRQASQRPQATPPAAGS